MLVNVTKDCLVNALQHVMKAISANGLIPILAGINIQASAEHLVVTASNLSMTIQCRIPHDINSMAVQRTGSIVVPARYFHEIIRRLDAGNIILETEEHFVMTITSGGAQIRLCGMDSAEFPFIHHAAGNPVNRLRIHNAVLKSAIKQVAVAVSASETRPVLTGVSFEYNDNSLNLVATDGIRLASKTVHIENKAKIGTKVIIPGKNLYEAAKMLHEEEITEIEIGSNQINFIAKDLQIRSALIEGVFPSVKNVIPQSFLCEIVIETGPLLYAVGRASVLAAENIISFTVSAGKLVLLSNTSDLGDIREEMPLKETRGEDFTISVNGKFVLDIIRCIDSEHVCIRFTGKTSPMVIIPLDPHSSALFLLPPVRTHH